MMPIDRAKNRTRPATAIPGGGGGGAWLGGKPTESSAAFKKQGRQTALQKKKTGSQGSTPPPAQDGQGGLLIDGGSRQSALQAQPQVNSIFGPAKDAGQEASQTGTSIFDPVLCEVIYRWFCPQGGAILDPFAGGSVRGIVAARLGYQYTGIDLSARQLAANGAQGADLCRDNPPRWIVGDSRDIATLAPGMYDLVFSCPPYFDLEVYSDNPADLSQASWEDFLSAYRQIIASSVSLLAEHRFACFVVGDIRDAQGYYRQLPWLTTQAFTDAGCRLYNEAVLVTMVGSLPIRVSSQFPGSRKLGKTHQNVLIFCKGDWRKAVEACGPVDISVDGFTKDP